MKNKNTLILSSIQLGSGTCSRINSWGLRSKNSEVDIAILWIGLGRDQFWRKQGALGETIWLIRLQQCLAFLSLRCCVPSVFPRIAEAVVLRASPSLRHNTYRNDPREEVVILAFQRVQSMVSWAHMHVQNVMVTGTYDRGGSWLCLTRSWGRVHFITFPFHFVWVLQPCTQSGWMVLTQWLILKHLMNTPLSISYVLLNLLKLIINYQCREPLVHCWKLNDTWRDSGGLNENGTHRSMYLNA